MTVLRFFGLLSGVLFLMVWVIYPVGVALIGRLRRHARPGDTGDTPVNAGPAADTRVTVVIATRETAAAVADRVSDCLRTDWPADRLEIVVAHDRGMDPPDPAQFRTGATIRFVPADAPGGKANALNAGCRAATGDVIVFADTFQRFAPRTIPALLAALAHPAAGAATGAYELAPGTGAVISLYWKFERWLRRSEARVHSSVGATGAVYAIRRALWQPLPAGLILDDVYTPMRIVLGGRRVAVADAATAIETRTPTPAQEYTRKVRTLTGVLQLCAWLPAVLVPGRNPIWIQFLFHKILRLLTPYWLLIVALWLVAEVVVRAGPGPLLFAAILVGLLALISWMASRSFAHRVRAFIVEALLVQAAVVVAGIKGLRGEWQVWDA